jgi:iron complex transport system ATP-binding protein
MTDVALSVDSLCLSIDGARLLRDVSVTLRRGEAWSIVGANGAGKSTLLRCLMRIQAGWTGHVRLFGRPLESCSQRDLARRMAYVPQAGGDQRFPFTVREFVRMGRYPYAGPFGSAHPGDRRAVDEAMERVGVDAMAERTMESLSGGERQKVFIAAALAQGSTIMLFDEPSTFLDYRHQTEVAAILRSLNRDAGTTTVVVTHDVNAAILAGGQALGLRHGEVVWSGPARDLACVDRLAAVFDASFRLLDDPVTGLRFVAPQGTAA